MINTEEVNSLVAVLGSFTHARPAHEFNIPNLFLWAAGATEVLTD
jgi:hypothetical protein